MMVQRAQEPADIRATPLVLDRDITVTSPLATAPIRSLPSFDTRSEETNLVEVVVTKKNEESSRPVLPDTNIEYLQHQEDYCYSNNGENLVPVSSENNTEWASRNYAVETMQDNSENFTTVTILAEDQFLEQAYEEQLTQAIMDTELIEKSLEEEEDEENEVSVVAESLPSRSTAPYNVWSYMEEVNIKSESGAATTPNMAHNTLPSISPAIGNKLSSTAALSQPSTTSPTTSSPVLPPPYMANFAEDSPRTKHQTLLGDTIVSIKSLEAIVQSPEAVVVYSTVSRSVQLSSTSEERGSTGFEDKTEETEAVEGASSLEAKVLCLQNEIASLNKRIDRLEKDRKTSPSNSPSTDFCRVNDDQDRNHFKSNRKKEYRPARRNEKKGPWRSLRDVVIMILKQGLINAAIVFVIWVISYKRQKGLQMVA
ncbi:hypothetical protein BG004_000683, partial [Podila humilis]